MYIHPGLHLFCTTIIMFLLCLFFFFCIWHVSNNDFCYYSGLCILTVLTMLKLCCINKSKQSWRVTVKEYKIKMWSKEIIQAKHLSHAYISWLTSAVSFITLGSHDDQIPWNSTENITFVSSVAAMALIKMYTFHFAASHPTTISCHSLSRKLNLLLKHMQVDL